MILLRGRANNISKISAFTLVELLVTIVIVGILSAISVAGFRQFSDSAKKATILSTLHDFTVANQAARDIAADRLGDVRTSFAVQWFAGGSNPRLEVSTLVGGVGGTPRYDLLSQEEINSIYPKEMLTPPSTWNAFVHYSEDLTITTSGATPISFGLSFDLTDCSMFNNNNNHFTKYSYIWTDGSKYNTKGTWGAGSC